LYRHTPKFWNCYDTYLWADAWSAAAPSPSTTTAIPIDPDLLWAVDVSSWSGAADRQIKTFASDVGILTIVGLWKNAQRLANVGAGVNSWCHYGGN